MKNQSKNYFVYELIQNHCTLLICTNSYRDRKEENTSVQNNNQLIAANKNKEE